ncbi:response regulator [bacterium]|nr:response regulator [bacterium]
MPNVLIIDDQWLLLEVLRTALEGEYAVKTARNGEEALAIMDRWKVDLVITDYSMPGMTGIEVIKAVRAMKHKPKVIFYTAVLNRDLEREAKAAGAMWCLSKPFELREMKEKILKALTSND